MTRLRRSSGAGREKHAPSRRRPPDKTVTNLVLAASIVGIFLFLGPLPGTVAALIGAFVVLRTVRAGRRP